MGEEVGGMDGARISRGVTTTVRRRWCYWRRPHQKVETSIFFLPPSLIFHLLNPQNHPSKRMYFPPAICHLLLCRPILLLPPIPHSIKVFSHESILHMRWPKYWSFSFTIIPSKEHPGLIFRMDWLDLLAVEGTHPQESSPTLQFKSINSSALSFLHSPTLTSIHDNWENHSLD